jgi:hypothetical protein
MSNFEMVTSTDYICLGSSGCQRKYVSTYGRNLVPASAEASLQELLKSCIAERDLDDTAKQIASLNLFYRCIRSMFHQMRQCPSLYRHPLDTTPICRLVGFASTPKIAPFSFASDIKAPLEVLPMLGVDINENLQFDADILFTISGRLEMNSWEDEQEMSDGNAVSVTGVNCAYSLLNHSCEPNVSCVRDLSTGNLVIQARRDIKAGEELYLSYVENAVLEGDRESRLKVLENWMGERPHHCPRCYPSSPLNMTAVGSCSVSAKRKRGDDVVLEIEQTPTKCHKARHTRSSRFQMGGVLQALAADYDSEQEYESPC